MINPELAFGIIGTIALIVAWFWETYENIKKHKIVIHTHFAVLYIFGNVLIAAYSWMIGNPIFFWMSIILLAAICSELAYGLLVKHGR
jgi:hypothetical protein